ncbi:hypothetical protein Tco_0747016 [Tanacetum coccineum]
MTTLADKAILSGADNRPPMLEKDMYDSWKSIMELYMMNRQHGRMILESVENGPLIWPSIEENGATNIILQGLQPEVYALVSNHKVAKELWERIQLLMQGTSLTKRKENQGDDPIDVINHMMSFLSAVVTSRYPTINNQLRNSSNPRQQATINDGRITTTTKFQGDKFSLLQVSDGRDAEDTNLMWKTIIINPARSMSLLNINLFFSSPNSVNSLEPTLSSRPTKVKVPQELPKVSMVNTSLKKLKHHLAGFDMVVKERTMATTITEGSWGFEHTKACFRDEIIPFVKDLKDLFNTFDQYLIDELSEVQNVFHQMEQAVEQHSLESKTFEVKMHKVLNKNERLLE